MFLMTPSRIMHEAIPSLQNQAKVVPCCPHLLQRAFPINLNQVHFTMSGQAWPVAILLLIGVPRKVSVSKACGRARQKLGQVRRICEGNQQEKHTSCVPSATEMLPRSGWAASMPAPSTKVKRCTKKTKKALGSFRARDDHTWLPQGQPCKRILTHVGV